jgi:hypothetical protein
MARRKKRNYFEPQRHPDHPRPVTRRQMIQQGFLTGGATIATGSVMSLFAHPGAANAASHSRLSQDLQDIINAGTCPQIKTGVDSPVKFICFDLAGGANMVGSNVLAGGPDGQFDFLSTRGYNKMGLPGDQVPGTPEVTPTATSNGDHTDTSLGLAFHSDSAFLRGMQSVMTPATMANVHGAVIPARSENDTGNNPHNPMYGIARAGADGELLTLIGSRTSDSGGNSMDPLGLVPSQERAIWRPTKVDRSSDVSGLVDTGALVGILSEEDAIAVMESVYRLSDQKMGLTTITADDVLRDLIRCGYLKAADVADRFADQTRFDVLNDSRIFGDIFDPADAGNREFEKTASVMKLVLEGFAGAGCITMGGYDYHGGRRAEGEVKDFRAGRCMGACLEFARVTNSPLMLYVFSDGSLSSNGVIDDTLNGRGKGEWTSDNQSTAASFFLVYSPSGPPTLRGTSNQLGYFTSDGSVMTASSPAANNVNLLVQTVVLNFMALRGQENLFADPNFFPSHGLGNAQLRDSLTVFNPIV